MNKGSIILAAVFLGIISILSLSVYSGIIEIKKPQNLLGLVGIDNSDGFKFVGSVDLENSSSTQNDYFSDNNKQSVQKAISAPTKTKKNKESVQTVVRVTSGATVKLNDNITSATAPIVSSTSLVILPIIITTSSAENSAPVQIQEQIQEQTSVQTLQAIQEPASEQLQTQNNTLQTQENVFNNILISEIMVGMEGNPDYEFIELYNPTANSIDLTGWSIEKRSSTIGSKPTMLVSSIHFKNKIIQSNKYFLLANIGGYDGQIFSDIFWPKSYTLAYSNNAIIFYNANGELIEEVAWTEIPKGQSIERESFSDSQFKTQLNPNPQNSTQN